jgi:gliding motility-associated-like protein
MKENICLGDTISLALSGRSDNADHFNWDFDGGSVITGSSSTGGPYHLSWHTPGIHVIKLRAITVEGCEGKDIFDTIKVIALPNAHISSNMTGVICLEDSLYISAIDSNEYGNSYEWSPAHFFHNTNKPGIWGRIETPGFVSLHVTNAFGCAASDSVLITPDACCKVIFPTAFTPNNDHHNDVFRPIFDGYHRFHSFRVTNRWGQTVFESTNSNVEWDGTFGGVPQDMGVYYYFIKFDCGGKSVTEKGDVTLIR